MTAVDTAVVLAAGRGTRLGARGLQHPKGFIRVAGGPPLIERSLALLRDAGIRRVLVVTGHLHAFYDALPGIERVHNPRHAESGSMYSLACVRDAVAGPFWLLESDLLYERAALAALAAEPSPSAILTSGATGSGDEVYVQAASNGQLEQLSKQRERIAVLHGELVGISRIAPDCFAAMLAHADAVFADTLHLEYEQALVAAARRVPVACPRVDDLAWTEIDTEAHFARAEAFVWPRIAARDGAAAP